MRVAELRDVAAAVERPLAARPHGRAARVVMQAPTAVADAVRIHPEKELPR
jgi:hypothetical protein